jgi:hypothetical protein
MSADPEIDSFVPLPRRSGGDGESIAPLVLIFGGSLIFALVLIGIAIYRFQTGASGTAIALGAIALFSLVGDAWFLQRLLSARRARREASYPEISIAPPTAAPGGELRVRWRFGDAADRVDRFDLSVHCTRFEKNTQPYKRQSHEFHASLVDSRDAAQIRSGGASVRLPPDALVSMPGEARSVTWEIRAGIQVRGYRRPVRGIYPLEVRSAR